MNTATVVQLHGHNVHSTCCITMHRDESSKQGDSSLMHRQTESPTSLHHQAQHHSSQLSYPSTNQYTYSPLTVSDEMSPSPDMNLRNRPTDYNPAQQSRAPAPSPQDSLSRLYSSAEHLPTTVQDHSVSVAPLPEPSAGSQYDDGGSSQGSSRAPSPQVHATSYTCTVLPPCRVCGDKASGFHYGVNTCEACKGFFRRCLKGSLKLKCAYTDSCVVNLARRQACASCRYRKCLAVGMSKTAIKTGRYTYEKRARDLEEVKRLGTQCITAEGGTGEVVGGGSLADECSMYTLNMSLSDRNDEVDKIIKHITTVHLENRLHGDEFYQKLPKNEAKYLEQRQLREQMFGPMKPIKRNEYKNIYQTTGIDVDGRREMIKDMVPSIEDAIRRYIRFAKALPGFKDLPLEDQLALIKGNRYEFDKLLTIRLFNVRHRTLANPWYPGDDPLIIDENTLRLYADDEEYIRMEFILAERLQKLQMTTEEVALLMGCAILTSDNVYPLTLRKRVEAKYNFLLQMFYRLLKRRYRDRCDRIFARITAILTEMRSQAIRHYEMESGFFVDNSDLLDTFCKSYTELMDREPSELLEETPAPQTSVVSTPTGTATRTVLPQNDAMANMDIQALTDIVSAIGPRQQIVPEDLSGSVDEFTAL